MYFLRFAKVQKIIRIYVQILNFFFVVSQPKRQPLFCLSRDSDIRYQFI